MDFKSQELFPSLTGSSAQPAAIWKKSNLPGLELGVGNSMERLDIPRENLVSGNSTQSRVNKHLDLQSLIHVNH